jgi:hypothetical protein
MIGIEQDQRKESIWRLYRWEVLQRSLRGGIPLPKDHKISERVGAETGWHNKLIHKALDKCKENLTIIGMR